MNWIWLDDKIYRNEQNTHYSGLLPQFNYNYAVAEFRKSYVFNKIAESVSLVFSGDTAFELYLNGEIIATGPSPVGGDFLGNEKPRSKHYSNAITVHPHSKTLDFYVRVKMGPVGIYEYSKGHGGFALEGTVTLEDNSTTSISTDSTWLARKNGAYTKPYEYDGRISPDDWTNATEITDIWNAEFVFLPQLERNVIIPVDDGLTVKAKTTEEFTLELDKIYAAILCLSVKAKGDIRIEVTAYETEIDSRSKTEILYFNQDCEYTGLQVHSIGALKIRITNESDADAVIIPKVITVNYPAPFCAKTVTSDDDLNLVLDVCAHTLKICRQHIHLDSPCHYEPLACTGDYYIESLMTAFSYGDMRLAEFDIIRTAELLRSNDGRMFHTTYSLIWVLMLYDIYMFTGNTELLEKCKDALIMLLDRFKTYIGENNIIEYPPDYMFVDWLYIDKITLHHPPKALGQTCLNMFYFGALEKAAEIFDILGDTDRSDECRTNAEELKKAVNEVLFDKDRQMYFEGLTTATPEHLLRHEMPQNTTKKYYRKHANILAAYFGICDREMSRNLIHRIMNDEIEGIYQAYFAHYLMEAVYRNGLRDEYTLQIAEMWKSHAKDCPKGLTEGFYPPEPTYSFDHSHAWGGTPLYSVPLALTGFKMIKAGFEEISLSPSLLGLEKADIQIPTPYGNITVSLEKGKETVYNIPEQIKCKRG
ncbi:MAG: hypothetical protein IJZ35_07135 [Clostridia bacterium]|nr:hypothetical protein [Clostridia bacterium]